MFEAAALPADRLDRRLDQRGIPAGFHAGGWVVPMVAQTPRLNKPPLVYWLQVASASALTLGDPLADAIWMYRLPSALCALGTVLITWRLGLRALDPRAAWLAAAILAVSPMLVWDAHQARADQLLTVCTAGAMYCLWRALEAGNTPRIGADGHGPGTGIRWAVGMWACVGLGVMAKGFITPLVVVLAIAAFCAAQRDWSLVRRTRPLFGVVLLAVVVAPWVWLLSRHIGLEIYGREVWREVFLRAATGAKDGGRAFLPPGLHAVLLAVLFWPGCLLIWQGLGRAIDRAWGTAAPGGSLASRLRARLVTLRRRAAGRRFELFLLAWVIPAWIVFELSPAKLPHYTMPLYAPLALLTAREAFAWQARARVGARLGVWAWLAVAALLPVAAAALVSISDIPTEGKVGGIVFVLGLIGLPVWGTLLVALQFARGTQWAAALVTASCAGAAALALTLHAVVPALVRSEKPRLLSGNLTERLFQQVRRLDPDGARPLASVYGEDSVVFQSRGRVEKLRPADQTRWLDLNPAGILIGTRETDAPGRDGYEIGGYVVLAPRRWSDGRVSDPPTPAAAGDRP